MDYEKASRILAYVNAVKVNRSQSGLDDATVAWIAWANKKADWFDPAVARNDEFFGKRKHQNSEVQKALKIKW